MSVKKQKELELQNRVKRPIVVSQAIIRPTGLIDPQIIIKPVENQVDDVLEQVRQRIASGQRVLITTLTKKFAEELDIYFKQINLKSAYIHSDVETLDRLDILADLRRGKYDVLIGINLLREGLDLPEVSLVAIFDADKEGFLRSRTSLIQIIGRAARHVEGTVVMYANRITNSMRQAIEETDRRRDIQLEYNRKYGIVAQSTSRHLKTIADDLREIVEKNEDFGKSKIVLTTMGFEEKEEQISLDGAMNIQSRFERKGKSKSVHSEFGQNRSNKKVSQVYANFDTQKELNIEELRKLNLTETELNERLKKAVGNMDFEMAAAIRDVRDLITVKQGTVDGKAVVSN